MVHIMVWKYVKDEVRYRRLQKRDIQIPYRNTTNPKSLNQKAQKPKLHAPNLKHQAVELKPQVQSSNIEKCYQLGKYIF